MDAHSQLSRVVVSSNVDFPLGAVPRLGMVMSGFVCVFFFVRCPDVPRPAACVLVLRCENDVPTTTS